MKRKRPWKPGGHPRRTAGSMNQSHWKAQQPKSNIPRKEAALVDAGN